MLSLFYFWFLFLLFCPRSLLPLFCIFFVLCFLCSVFSLFCIFFVLCFNQNLPQFGGIAPSSSNLSLFYFCLFFCFFCICFLFCVLIKISPLSLLGWLSPSVWPIPSGKSVRLCENGNQCLPGSISQKLSLQTTDCLKISKIVRLYNQSNVFKDPSLTKNIFKN